MGYQKGATATVYFALFTSGGVAVTSGTTTTSITKDGGTQAATTNTAVHEGNGQWSVVLTATEMDADHIGVLATNSGGSAIPDHVQFATVATLSSVEVIPELTHYCDGATSDSVIEISQGFAGSLALVPDIGDATILTVNSAALTGAASVTGTDLAKDKAQRAAIYDVTALSTVGTYTATVSVTTTDGQTIISTGSIIVS